MRHHETEVKIPIADLTDIRRRLRAAGFRALQRRAFEDNVLFDMPGRPLRAVRSVLRLRHYGRKWVLTYKGTPKADTRYKSRLEYESEIIQPEALRLIFHALGLVPVFRYQKYRTHYVESTAKKAAASKRAAKPRFEISLDETPIGIFIELEGSRAAIDRAAKTLGYSAADYSTKSYGALYLEKCRQDAVEPGEMVFPAQPRGHNLSICRLADEHKEQG
jgi:adenylate cyclase, class 2